MDDFEWFFKLVWILWIIAAVASLVFAGVVIWGIIELVQWVTSL